MFDNWDDDYANSIADAPRTIYCIECDAGYSSEDSECPECGCEDFGDTRKFLCSHCNAEACGDAYCNRCGNRINYDYDNLQKDSMDFANPGGNSALRAATPNNPRIFPCPDCGEPDKLTPSDRAHSYCCDECADHKERGW